ncbi:MAG: redoxin family protein [Pseudomonadota bacterium]
MTRWIAALPIAVFAAFIVLGGVQLTRDRSGEEKFAGEARPAPVLALPTLAGGEAVYPGDGDPGVRIVNFWATWCAPCAIEHPLLLDMAAAGAVIDGVLYKDEPNAAAYALTQAGDPFVRVPLDPTGDAGLAFGVAGVPETFVIDADGQIIHTHRGPLDQAAARKIMELAGG